MMGVWFFRIAILLLAAIGVFWIWLGYALEPVVQP